MFASGTMAPEASSTLPLISPVIIWAGARIQNRGTKTAAHKHFDKTNLPDPLILTNYFVLKDGKISQLITLLNKTIWKPAKA